MTDTRTFRARVVNPVVAAPSWFAGLAELTLYQIALTPSASSYAPFQRGTGLSSLTTTVFPNGNDSPAGANDYSGAALDLSRTALMYMCSGHNTGGGDNSMKYLRLKTEVPSWELYTQRSMPIYPEGMMDWYNANGVFLHYGAGQRDPTTLGKVISQWPEWDTGCYRQGIGLYGEPVEPERQPTVSHSRSTLLWEPHTDSFWWWCGAGSEGGSYAPGALDPRSPINPVTGLNYEANPMDRSSYGGQIGNLPHTGTGFGSGWFAANYATPWGEPNSTKEPYWRISASLTPGGPSSWHRMGNRYVDMNKHEARCTLWNPARNKILIPSGTSNTWWEVDPVTGAATSVATISKVSNSTSLNPDGTGRFSKLGSAAGANMCYCPSGYFVGWLGVEKGVVFSMKGDYTDQYCWPPGDAATRQATWQAQPPFQVINSRPFWHEPSQAILFWGDALDRSALWSMRLTNGNWATPEWQFEKVANMPVVGTTPVDEFYTGSGPGNHPYNGVGLFENFDGVGNGLMVLFEHNNQIYVAKIPGRSLI